VLDHKIFGIGLPKTGTSSLHAAAKILGLRSVHYLHDAVTVRQLKKGDYRLRALEDVDLASDIPVPAIFPQLDRAFPGSKFILTTRDEDAWVSSQSKAVFNQDPPRPGSHRAFYRAMLYGVIHYSDERFRWVHQDHHAKVESYFSGPRAKDLLVMNITTAADWEPLCGFLGLPVPDVPFPHKNPARSGPAAKPRPKLRSRLRLDR